MRNLLVVWSSKRNGPYATIWPFARVQERLRHAWPKSLVEWVEKGVAPERVVASGRQFTSAPTPRSRPLCPYPEQVRYTGPVDGHRGSASNYICIAPR